MHAYIGPILILLSACFGSRFCLGASMGVYENVRLREPVTVPNASAWSGVDLVTTSAFRSAPTFSTTPSWPASSPAYSGKPIYGATIAGPTGTTWALLADILGSPATLDVIRLQQPNSIAGPYTITGLALFSKIDFTGISSGDRLTIEAGDTFVGKFADQTGAIDGSEEIRWVIKDGDSYFISAATSTFGGATTPTTVSQQPRGLAWFDYDPASSITAIGSAATPSFADIAYVGFRLEGVRAAATTGALRIAATQLSFGVTIGSELPARLIPLPATQTRLHDGMLDVTLAPYLADNTGTNDCRQAIQNAIDDAYAANLIVFFPSGTYRCDGPLSCIQVRGPTSLGQRKFAHKLVGSSTGHRPVLKLSDGAVVNYTHPPGSGAPTPTFPIFLRFAWVDDQNGNSVVEESPSRHYCATLRGINIDMGNNPNVTAVRMLGAQYCVIEDVAIEGTAFAYGVDGLPGSGGSITNLKVTGGKIGVFQNEYRPTPLLTGLELVGQSEYGIRTTIVRGPTVVAGFRIVGPASPAPGYRAVSCESSFVGGGGLNPSVGNLVMEDGSIEVSGIAGKAIYNHAQDVYLQNVYVKAATVIESGMAEAPADILLGDAGVWHQLRRYVFRVGADEGHFMINGSSQGAAATDTEVHALAAGASVPSDLLSKHVWSASFPSWDEPQRISITDFGATRDNATDDDAPAIQAALNAAAQTGGPHEGKTVFIPRGHFHVSSPVQVPGGSRLVGAGETISILEVDRAWTPVAATSVLATEDDPNAEIFLAHFGIVGNEPTSAGSGLPDMTAQRLLRYVTCQSGRMWWRDLQLDQRGGSGVGKQAAEPLVLFTNGAGGRVFNLCLDNGGSEFAGGHPLASHHLLSVSGASQPLTFYDPSIEHLHQDSGQVHLSNAQDVRFFALKIEGSGRFLDAENVTHLQILGTSGNYGQDDTAIFRLQGACPDVRIANVGRQQAAGETVGVWLLDGAASLSDDKPITLYAKDAPKLRLLAGTLLSGEELNDGASRFFGSTTTGGSIIQTFTIVNDGFASLTGLSLSKSGPHPDEFNVSDLPATFIAPGDSLAFTLTFSPAAAGTREAVLHIASNEGGSAASYDINVIGMGIALSAQETWRQHYFGTTSNNGTAADQYDYDNDGLANLMEWACGLDPTLSDSPKTAVVLFEGNVVFSYTRSVSAVNAGAVFIVEWSDTLAANAWFTTGVSQAEFSNNGTLQQMKATLPGGNLGRRFVRLNVSAPP
jgi:hypothetical protein